MTLKHAINAIRRRLTADQTPPPSAPKNVPPYRRPQDPYDPNLPLVQLSPFDAVTLGNLYEGCIIYGETGSGKSSGPGATFLKAFMRAGMGGIVFTVKPDECALIRKYAEETGRAESVVVFSPSEKYRFNFLQYEQRRKALGAGLTENIVRLFTAIQSAFERGEDAGGKQERFWRDTLNQLLRNAIDLIVLAGEDLSVTLLHDVVISAPTSPDQIQSEAWLNSSICYQLIERALNDESLTERQKSDLRIVGKFFLTSFPQLPSDTRGSIIATFESTADIFLRGTIGDLFSTSLNIVPEITFEGAILVIDLPVKIFGHVGLACQILWKRIWQEAVERRDINKQPRPVFCWMDEGHTFVNDYDVVFQGTARSSRCCTTVLSQNLPSFFWSLGGEQKGRALTDSLMGNLALKIFCANSDPKTNEWASSIFGKSFQQKFSSGISNQEGGDSRNAGATEALHNNIEPSAFMTLRKGGSQNGFLVEAIVGQGGRIFKASGQTFIKTAFRQV